MQMYFIALVLPPELDLEIRKFKEYMRERHGCRVALRSPAHLTLIAPFWMDPLLETSLEQETEKIAFHTAEFTLKTSGFSSFKPRTIFIGLQPSEALSELYAKASLHFSLLPQFGIRTDPRPYHPHITIATRDLSKKAYYEAIDHFEGMDYEREWTAKTIAVLRHNGASWDVMRQMEFGK